MKKQTRIWALTAAALFALVSLTSGGKAQAAGDTSTPYAADTAGLTPTVAMTEVGWPGELPAVASRINGAGAPNVVTLMDNGKAVPFTATTGLDKFSSYHMDYTVSFDGTRQGQPASGKAEGTLEATKVPEAKHVQATVAGTSLSQLGVPGTLELYYVNSTIYYKDPQDGTWIAVPERLVSRFLPGGIPAPEDYVELPVTAVRQPGRSTVNGVVTQRYTFDRENLADSQNYDDAKGTIWVAVDGNYVVRYEATFTGQHENLGAGGVEVMDNGSINVRYELSNVNNDLTITAPKGARGLGLLDLLKLSSSLR
jgi:hypothetical protein